MINEIYCPIIRMLDHYYIFFFLCWPVEDIYFMGYTDQESRLPRFFSPFNHWQIRGCIPCKLVQPHIVFERILWTFLFSFLARFREIMLPLYELVSMFHSLISLVHLYWKRKRKKNFLISGLGLRDVTSIRSE